MAEIARLPGEGCRHFQCGRCLYEEHLNPGYDAGYRCDVLEHWADAYEAFLVRAESFRVEPDAVPELWALQFQRLARKTFRCERFEYDAEAGAPACLHVAESLCLLCLPVCEGRCRHYHGAPATVENE
ncbi:hypothetical protein [Pseudodesulfovibrio sp.]|uniref:hypothetical protein n=1 Tax=unclassified Pseudodesulfovibrio TaxID=2661612 RepID=UPI003AFFBAAE